MARRIRKETLKLEWRQHLLLKILVLSKIEDLLEESIGDELDSDFLALADIFELNDRIEEFKLASLNNSKEG